PVRRHDQARSACRASQASGCAVHPRFLEVATGGIMKRVWVVDDKIPLHELYDGPYPARLNVGLVRHLVEQLPREAWEEAPVLDLCRALCAPDFEPSFFLSPEGMLQAFADGAVPPHAVIFDWEYPG